MKDSLRWRAAKRSAGKLNFAFLLTSSFGFSLLTTCLCIAATPSDVDTMELLRSKQLGFEDGRAHFREIFCAIVEDHGADLPDYKTCDDALVQVDEEPRGDPMPVNLAPSDGNYLVGLVPGFAWQCVRPWMNNSESLKQHLTSHGYDLRLFEVDGLSSTAKNARQIKNHVSDLPVTDQQRPIILIGFSKGAVDILESVSKYPELRDRVAAIVSIAGAIGGSPIAMETSQTQMKVLAQIPWSGCEVGDAGAMASLSPVTRQQWLVENPLPERIRYYSVITYPDPSKISFGLNLTYRKLAKIDVRNDGNLLFYDQLIPGATLLAFVNADHWAMSIPVTRQKALNRITFANKNKFPREALVEAVLRYVEEDLSTIRE